MRNINFCQSHEKKTQTTRPRVVQTANLKQGVTGADAVAAVHDLKTSQQDKIFQAKVQDTCARSYILNTVFL